METSTKTCVSDSGMRVQAQRTLLPFRQQSPDTWEHDPPLSEAVKHNLRLRPSYSSIEGYPLAAMQTREAFHAQAQQQGFTLLHSKEGYDPEDSLKKTLQEVWEITPQMFFQVEYRVRGIHPNRYTFQLEKGAKLLCFLRQDGVVNDLYSEALKAISMSRTFTHTGECVTCLHLMDAPAALLARVPQIRKLPSGREELSPFLFSDLYSPLRLHVRLGITAADITHLPPTHVLRCTLELTKEARLASDSLPASATVSEVTQLSHLCELDAVTRQRLGATPSSLEAGQALYGAWMAWINDYSDVCPPFFPELEMGAMLSLPSLLCTICCDGDAHYKLEQVVAQCSDAELTHWWCTPDALGKTGAQWYLTGMVGDGDRVRGEQRVSRAITLLDEKTPENTATPRRLAAYSADHAQTWMARTLSNGATERGVSAKRAWGIQFLATLRQRLGSSAEEGWVTPRWSPAGIWIEAALKGKVALDVWQDIMLPDAAWQAPVAFVLSVLDTHAFGHDKEPGYELCESAFTLGSTTPLTEVMYCLMEEAREGNCPFSQARRAADLDGLAVLLSTKRAGNALRLANTQEILDRMQVLERHLTAHLLKQTLTSSDLGAPRFTSYTEKSEGTRSRVRL